MSETFSYRYVRKRYPAFFDVIIDERGLYRHVFDHVCVYVRIDELPVQRIVVYHRSYAGLRAQFIPHRNRLVECAVPYRYHEIGRIAVEYVLHFLIGILQFVNVARLRSFVYFARKLALLAYSAVFLEIYFQLKNVLYIIAHGVGVKLEVVYDYDHRVG